MLWLRCSVSLLCFLLPITASADIYKRTAADGKVYYTDIPSKLFKYKLIITTQYKKGTRSGTSSKQLIKNRKKYTPLIAKAAKKYQVDEKLIHAVIHTESAYNAKALSSAGAVGLMQLMPATAKRYGVSNRHSAAQSIDGGTHYLKDLMAMFDSNIQLVLAGYNAGEGAVKKYNNSIPPYPETRHYVQKVLRLYRGA